MTKGKIVLVPFSFDDFSAIKVRPAICLTEPIGRFGHIVIAFISSVIENYEKQVDFLVDDRELDFLDTGLNQTSVIKLYKRVSIPKTSVLRQLGILPGRHFRIINSMLIDLFQLTPLY